MRSLLATSADAGYLEAAKQLFAGAYHHGGWRGDYLLLAHDVADRDLDWFRDHGVLIRHCSPLAESKIGGRHPVLADRFHLFSSEFRGWDTILYSDSDVIVRGCLDSLVGGRGFFAVPDWNPYLRLQILPAADRELRNLSRSAYRELRREIAAHYDLRAPAFCAGFFVFTTDSVGDSAYADLRALLDRYESISRFGDQLVMNLYFQRRWQKLPEASHMMLYETTPQWPLRSADVDALTLHFVGPTKPWQTQGAYGEEWRETLERAESIDLSSVPAARAWSPQRLARASSRIERRLRLPRTIKRFVDVAAWKDRFRGARG